MLFIIILDPLISKTYTNFSCPKESKSYLFSKKKEQTNKNNCILNLLRQT